MSEEIKQKVGQEALFPSTPVRKVEFNGKERLSMDADHILAIMNSRGA